MRRSRVTVSAVAALGVVLVLPGGSASRAAATSVKPASLPYAFCPAARPALTANLRWTTHRLADGVELRETIAHDAGGRVVIRAVTADLAESGVSVQPLHRSLSHRHSLTTLAAHRRLVAATNGMYFSFGYGAPVVPFIADDRPVVLSTAHQPAAGIGADGHAEDGQVWLDADVTVTSPVIEAPEQTLTAVNEVSPPAGLALYTGGWGTGDIPLAKGSSARLVEGGAITSGAGRHVHVPPGGSLLVANGGTARTWLKALSKGYRVTLARHVDTDAEQPFAQAYGTGTQLVAEQGEPRTHLYCRRGAILAARTAIGWDAAGTGLTMLTVEAARHHQHGLDENQMSALMVSLGVSRAFALDGGGSTELVTRLSHGRRLAVRTYLPEGAQRAIPVGVGIYADR